MSTLVSSPPAGCHEPSRAGPRPGDSGGPRAESGQRGQSHPDGQHQQGAAKGGEAGRPDREVRRPAGLRECLSARAANPDVFKRVNMFAQGAYGLCPQEKITIHLLLTSTPQ